ncbi:ABC transporter permease [Neiella sp. HB171785]|uniref:ABC transporter permease n=1 Tax=Neiella litorisoli TaxID=2771431 RepID=A0A8J6QLF8_9GAMM|nr:ABC transporter permease [Neiella litorisoli]MBD1390476.1 ABC transporter permease [Neiella litorisoli]
MTKPSATMPAVMTVSHALAGHYRRHPLQALFLFTGIVIATVLLVATQLINAQAQASYAKGTQLFEQNPIGYLVAAQGQRQFSMASYVALRRQGFDQLLPVLHHNFQSQHHGIIAVMGIDWLSLPATPQASANGNSQVKPIAPADLTLEDFLLPPYRLMMAPARMTQLALSADQTIALTNTTSSLPPVIPAPDNSGVGHQALMDLQALQAISNRQGMLSAIWVLPMSEQRLAQLQQQLPPDLRFRPAAEPLSQAALAESLHLNLAAMGLLSFVVGLFLAFNAIQFSYTDRQPLLRRLRLSGTSQRQLYQALSIELLLFVLVGSAVGYWLGAWLATLLLPGLGQTLAQLYGVYISYPNKVIADLPLMPLLMTSLAALLAAIVPMRQIVQQPLLNRYRQQIAQHQARNRDRQLLLVALACLLVAVALSLWANSLWHGLACLALVLLGGALALPAALRASLSIVQRLVPANRPLLQWLIADSRWLLGPAAISLMAMTLALVANSGLNTMIGSFRAATLDWLEQRLAAPIYLSVADGQRQLGDWLSQHAPQVAIAERHTLRHGQLAHIEIASLPPMAAFRNSIELIEQVADAPQQFAQGQGIYISERHQRLDGGELDQQVWLCDGLPNVPVLGVYHDYGNPRSQWLLDEKLLRQCWPQHIAQSTALLAAEGAEVDWPQVMTALSDSGLIRPEQIIDQQQIKKMAMAVFDQTFTVTEALNGLTLLVAGIGIFCATSAIHHHRVQQQAQLAAMGVSQSQRLLMILSQWSLLALLSMIIVWPFGTLLAWVLASLVTPLAFGWSFSTELVWQHYPVLAVLALACVVVATLWPSWRLHRVSIASLLKEVDE